MHTGIAEYGRWKSRCGIIFRTRDELRSHNKKCSKCAEEKSKIASETQRKNWQNLERRKAQSEITVFNNFWKYRAKNPIIYESKVAGKMKLDSNWELEVAKRLDELNVE